MDIQKSIVLESKHLKLSYGKKKVFSNININFNRNNIAAIVGPSGCGKSSFLMCLNRLIEMEPTATLNGTVNFNGESVYSESLPIHTIRRKIAMIFQHPTPLPFSIKKNFSIPLKECGFKKSEIEHKMESALRNVGLWTEAKDRLNRSATNLSGGQKQRLCIARALSLEPEVLLLDEPCSSLDPISTGVIEDLLKQLSDQYTSIIVTHNLAQARRMSHRTALFWWDNGQGYIVEDSPTDEFFNEPKLEITKNYLLGERL